MGTFRLEMETGNAAFRRADNSLDTDALRATLHTAIEELFSNESSSVATLAIRIRDENGNTVGTMSLDEWI